MRVHSRSFWRFPSDDWRLRFPCEKPRVSSVPPKPNHPRVGTVPSKPPKAKRITFVTRWRGDRLCHIMRDVRIPDVHAPARAMRTAIAVGPWGSIVLPAQSGVRDNPDSFWKRHKAPDEVAWPACSTDAKRR